jgi:hypothetical protein
MPRSPKHTMKAVVTGDVTMDWHLRHEPQADNGGQRWRRFGKTQVFCQRGGAALLADLVKQIADRIDPKPDVAGPMMPLEGKPIDGGYSHAYAMYELRPKSSAASKESVWRASLSLGLTEGPSSPATDPAKDCRSLEEDYPDAEVVVLDDATFGYRNQKRLWPKALAGQPDRVVLKMAGDVAAGSLWDEIVSRHGDRLIVVVPAYDLRRKETLISRQLSWERTAQDVVSEWQTNPKLAPFRRCADTIISFGLTGALHLTSQAGELASATLYYDPLNMEDEWEKNQGGKGGMYGYTVTLTAAIVREIFRHPKTPNISDGIQTGIAAMRKLYFLGNSEVSKQPATAKLEFSHRSIAEEITRERTSAPQALGIVPVPLASPTNLSWRILSQQYEKKPANIAATVAQSGVTSLQDVPIGRFGKLVTVDRREIEALRSIQILLREYVEARKSKPISIAVFGPPGSGKSFAVKQVAKGIASEGIQELKFNLSQFGDPDDLLGAFHQVRDASLSGKTPLVFWDEFDSTLGNAPLGWLRYFLAPMQDGEFQEGQITHPIGHSIFVFAGGTARTVNELGEALGSDNARDAKVPDFKSRLRGSLDVLGPDPHPDASADPHYAIRRAILLRSMLGELSPQLFEKPRGEGNLRIDSGVLRAFLRIDAFKHGARSLEAIVATSTLSGRDTFVRSALPFVDQLDLHVDGTKFLELVRSGG